MSRWPGGSKGINAEIAAILGPIFNEHDAAARRERLDATSAQKAPPDLSPLDSLIEVLADAAIARARPTPPPSTRPAVSRPSSQSPPIPSLPSMPPLPAGKSDNDQDQSETPGYEFAPPPVPPPTRREVSRPSATPAPPKVPARATAPIFRADSLKDPILPALAATSPAAALLYDDVVMLSALNDREGLLVSLERLLTMAKLGGHIKTFIDTNERKLIALYEGEFRSFTKKPTWREAAVDNTMPRAFVRSEKVAIILPLINGKNTVEAIMKKAKGLQRIETLGVLGQLRRIGIIEL